MGAQFLSENIVSKGKKTCKTIKVKLYDMFW